MRLQKSKTRPFHPARSLAICLTLLILLAGETALATPLFIGDSWDLQSDSDWAAAVSQMNNQPNAYSKNDHLFNVNWLVDTYTPDPSSDISLPENLTLLGKYENWHWTETVWDEDTSAYFIGDLSGKRGYWYEVSQEFDGPIYFSVKAGNQFALYYATDIFSYKGQDFPWSSWWTQNCKQLSHISFWTAGETPPDTPDPVPEPATLMLLGIGVLGMARTGRKTLS